MSRLGLAIAAACAAGGLLAPSPAAAAADLTITATHDRDPLLRTSNPNTTVYAGKLTLTVANHGDQATDGPVTVTDTLPTGLTPLVNNPGFDAGPVAASGDGWSCTGTTCTRSDPLAPGAAYPPITISVDVAADAPPTITNSPTVTAHGQGWKDQADDAIDVEVED